MNEVSPSGPQAPRPFNEIPGLWAKVIQMTEEFFAQEAPRASSSNVIISVLILAAASTILSVFSSLIGGGFQADLLPPEFSEFVDIGGGQNLVCTAFVGIFGAIFGFYLSNGIVFIGARSLGGSGDFTTQTYLQSLFAVPLGIASGVVALVPCVGLFGVLAVGIYAIVLNVRSIKVVHNLSTGKAVAAVFVPILIIMVILTCIFVVGLVLLGPVIESVFDDLMRNMPY